MTHLQWVGRTLIDSQMLIVRCEAGLPFALYLLAAFHFHAQFSLQLSRRPQMADLPFERD